MIKKIEVLPITNEAELSAALKNHEKLEVLLMRQSLYVLILTFLGLAILLNYYLDYIEYFFFEYGFLGVIAFGSIAATPSFIFVHFFINKYRPLYQEIERYVNENPVILDRSSGTLSEQELSFLSSLKREDGANLQRMEKRVKCRE